MTSDAPSRISRSWPVTVRRVRPEDRDPVLAFTRDTFDGWDYIHEVWDEWQADVTGAFLVATAECAPNGAPPTDRDGSPLAPGRPIAIAHLAMASPSEGWVEGIRVDPTVRGMDVATDLVAGSLQAAVEAGATVVRYVTSMVNEGSLRLAARHGLLPVAEWRFHGRGHDDDRTGPQGRAVVEAALAQAAADGTLRTPAPSDADGSTSAADADDGTLRTPAPSDADGSTSAADAAHGAVRAPGGTVETDADAWFARIAADPTFRAGHGLYEHDPWTYQALTRDRLADHLRAGEVLALGPDQGDRWALLIIDRARSLEDGELLPALLVGDGDQVIRLLDRLGGEPGPLARLRLPDPAPFVSGHEDALRDLGYTPHPGRMIVVEKRLR